MLNRTKISHSVLVSFLFVCVLLFQCNKDATVKTAPYHIYGKVVDAISNTSVSGAHVFLIKNGISVTTLVADTIADSSGNFSFTANEIGDAVQATASKYYNSQFYGTSDPTYLQNHLITIDPQTYLKIHAVNTQKLYYYLEIHTTIKGAIISCNGLNIDTVVTGAIYDATNTTLEYGLLNSSGYTLKTTQISAIRLDTTLVQINY